MWWTITGNFGNILPIDWSKSFSRQMQIPTLNLSERSAEKSESEVNDLCSEDEAVANDLDMHTLILNDLASETVEPIKTAEEVIKEIVDIMDEVSSIEEEEVPTESARLEKTKEIFGEIFYEDKLKTLTISQLNDLYMEMEVLFREYSETLIAELAARDELEFEKELKNSFISLLLAVQNRRRQYHTERKRDKNRQGKMSRMDEFQKIFTVGICSFSFLNFSDAEPKYLTTVIPYHMEDGPPPHHILQILIKSKSLFFCIFLFVSPKNNGNSLSGF